MSEPIPPASTPNVWLQLTFRWLWVGVPLVWGVCETAIKSRALFR